MGLLLLLIVGFLAGMIASKIMHSYYPWYVDIILGIIGAYVGGFILGFLGVTSCAGLNCNTSTFADILWQIIAGIIGAIIVIAIVHAVQRRPMR